MRNFIFCSLIFVFVFQSFASTNGDASDKSLTAVKVNSKITIDGLLNEPIWQRPGFTQLVQQEPDQGVAPTQKTECWTAYDNEAFYFAARFYDTNPDSILARLVRRDFVWGDPSDGFVLYLDSFRDKQTGYFFYVSAAGTLADGVLLNDSKFTDISWDAVWEGVPNIDDKGWTVEVRIPYSQIRFKENESQVWGINVERYYSRRAETDMIAYTPRNESGFASRFPALVGIEGIKPKARIEAVPYVTGKTESLGSANPGDPFNSDNKYKPGIGLDIKMGLGNSLNLVGTINPDFGQVEVDPAIVNLTDVESTFQERRPFFTEGIGIFTFANGGTNNNPSYNWNRPNIFYSRRIGRAPQGELPNYDFADVPEGTHILGAAKITGQVFGDWKLGTVHALTKREIAEIQLDGKRTNVEVEPLTYYGVLRTKKDFNNGAQGIGVLSTFTNRFFDDASLQKYVNKNAFVAAADGWTYLDEERTYVLTGWAGVSRVSGTNERITNLQRNSGHYFQRPDADHINVDSTATSLFGYAGRFMLNKNRGKFTFNAALGFVSPQFEINDLGYNSYSDKINTHLFASYNWSEPTEYYQRMGIRAATYLSYDYGGNKTAHGYFFGGYFMLPNLSGANFSMSYNPESYNARKTRGGPLTLNPVSRSYSLNMYTDNRKWWVLGFGGNYYSGEAAESYTIYTDVEFKATSTLTLSIGPSISKNSASAQWIKAYDDATASATYDRRYVFAELDQTTFAADIRADWIISPTLSLQVYIQPLISTGNYTNFKTLQKPKTFDFITYGENGSTIETLKDGNEISEYTLDADGDGNSNPHTIGNPNFNYLSLRGNAVLRWEYMPGAALFLVWTQSRQDVEPTGDFYFDRSINHLFDVKPDNIFMLKFTYWLGI